MALSNVCVGDKYMVAIVAFPSTISGASRQNDFRYIAEVKSVNKERRLAHAEVFLNSDNTFRETFFFEDLGRKIN